MIQAARTIIFLMSAWLISHVYADSKQLNKPHDCTAIVGEQVYHCALGRTGVLTPHEKKEGDGATPTGVYPLGKEIWFRADQVNALDIHSILPKRIIQKHDGWCDDPKKPEYNQYVKLPYKGNHETLWRENGRIAYDILMTIQYNTSPVIPGKGSAIFLHVAQPDKEGQFLPTAGCISFAKKDLLEILPYIGLNTLIKIDPDKKITFLNLEKKLPN